VLDKNRAERGMGANRFVRLSQQQVSFPEKSLERVESAARLTSASEEIRRSVSSRMR
jgi:hypothetical protein